MGKRQNHSPKRELVFRIIQETKSHPNADWVCDKVRHEHPGISLGTIYRHIAAFKRQNLVRPVAFVEGHERIDANTTPHTHFVCQECGTVLDIDEPPADASLLAGIEARMGIRIQWHNLLLYGNCTNCLANK